MAEGAVEKEICLPYESNLLYDNDILIEEQFVSYDIDISGRLMGEYQRINQNRV